YLRSLGVTAETPVCICTENPLDMVTGLLGIFKAGGVYVPLDPAYTKNRLTFMLEDSKAAVLVTSARESLTAQWPGIDVPIVGIDRDSGSIPGESVENPVGNVKPRHLAYLIYTSGSTGKPKGVLVSHRSIIDYCQTFQKYYKITGSDRLLQFYRFTFDASLEQLLPPFTAGAAVVLKHSAVWDVKEFCKAITGNGITVVFQPPAFLHEFVKALDKNPGLISNHKIRAVIVGGDVMSPGTVKLWRRVFSNSVRLFNVYGPTETTIAAVIFDVTAGFSKHASAGNIPIGRPIANRGIYIMDCHGNPVPIGIPGELYIGGSGLARGYLNHPELTAEKFIYKNF
ncbi:MAG: AMP-binding protein, partial [bacterium]|nr:AMP-binding protein [bacterium]